MSDEFVETITVPHRDLVERTGSRDRRQGDRHETAQPVAIFTQSTETIADLLDLSSKGARLCIPDGLVPAVGSKLVLVLLGDTRIRATVAWVGDKSFGIEFDAEVQEFETHLEKESLGQGYYTEALRLQSQISRRQATKGS